MKQNDFEKKINSEIEPTIQKKIDAQFGQMKRDIQEAKSKYSEMNFIFSDKLEKQQE